MPRGCKATNGWRRKRLRDRWRAENRTKPSNHKKPKPRLHVQGNKRVKVKRGDRLVKHETGHTVLYNAPPERATIRTVVSGDLTKPLPYWPGFNDDVRDKLEGAYRV